MPWVYIIQNKELCGRDNKYINPEFDKEYKETQKLKEALKKQEE
jgi:hypothetical protein